MKKKKTNTLPLLAGRLLGKFFKMKNRSDKRIMKATDYKRTK